MAENGRFAAVTLSCGPPLLTLSGLPATAEPSSAQ
jgi:hypothetical protein